jgi:hypothetical protein
MALYFEVPRIAIYDLTGLATWIAGVSYIALINMIHRD